MKAGTLVFVIVLILIAFGFVFSDNIHTHQDLQVAISDVETLSNELEQSQKQLTSCRAQNVQDAQRIHNLEGQVTTLQVERNDLQTQLQQADRSNLIASTDGNWLDFLGSNPIVLVAALIVQATISKLRTGKFLGFWMPGTENASLDEYVKLSQEELAWLIHLRRTQQSRKRNN